MLQTLKIKNFQKHKNLTISLDPYVTTIMGPNSTGKTAILRALWWLCTNRPTGNSFIRHGKKFSRVLLELDGHTIIKVKGKKNLYVLDDKEYKAFNREIPEPISRLLNLEQINYQRQLDPHFWFHLSPGQVSRELNQIVDFSLIDSSQSNIASEVREVQTELKVAQVRLKEVKKEVKSLSWVQDIDTDLKRLESKEEKLVLIQGDCIECEAIVLNVRSIASKQTKMALAGEEGKKALKVGNGMESIVNQYKNLKSSIQSIREKQMLIRENKKELLKVKSELSKIKNCPLCFQPLEKKTHHHGPSNRNPV